MRHTYDPWHAGPIAGEEADSASVSCLAPGAGSPELPGLLPGGLATDDVDDPGIIGLAAFAALDEDADTDDAAKPKHKPRPRPNKECMQKCFAKNAAALMYRESG